jgi:hypothetical protein
VPEIMESHRRQPGPHQKRVKLSAAQAAGLHRSARVVREHQPQTAIPIRGSEHLGRLTGAVLAKGIDGERR